MKENLPAILVPILLILLGTFSPSNGVDEGYNKGTMELLITAGIIILTAIVFYLLHNRIRASRAGQDKAEKATESEIEVIAGE